MKNNKSGLYYLLIVVLLILIGISSFFLFYFYNLRGEDLSIEEVSINEANKMAYTVKLEDNNYYQSNADNDTYITTLIENINTYFNYSVAFSSNITGEYSYYIVGNVVHEKNGEEVKSEIYKGDIVKYEITGNVINLSNSFDINLKSIFGDYQEFKNKYNVDANAYIEYVVYINYSVFSEQISKSIINSKELMIKIPCDDITKITITEDDIKTRSEFSELNYDDDELYLIICLEFMGSIIIYILLIVLVVKQLGKKESLYEHELKYILKKYDNKIIHINDLPDLSKHDVLFVDTFDDLVEASNSLSLPINYVEIIENQEATFIVIHRKLSYVYKISNKSTQ